MARKGRANLAKGLAVLFALSVWQVAALFLGHDLLLVSPIRVVMRLGTLWLEPDFWQTVFFTLGRIVAGFLLALFIGSALAVAAGRARLVEIFLWPFVITVKAVPVASFIIISPHLAELPSAFGVHPFSWCFPSFT
jgi:NitT/TauT family transport system permease protein